MGERPQERGGRAPRRLLRPLRRFLVLLALGTAVVAPLLGAPGAGAGTGTEGPTVLRTSVDDAITPIIADHLSDAVDEAEAGGHEALLVEIDTPGGLSTSMREIVQDFLAAEVPVVVHVTPSGARAASAGALIAWSSHVVAMAPGTTIGASTPVQLEGGEVADKVVEDAAAFARAVAEERGRDVEVAAEAVTEGRALSASEAVDAGVADLEVGADELLGAIDGTEVSVDGATRELRTAAARVVDHDMTWLRSVLQFLADPNLAFIFMSIGTLGIVYELASPGIGAGGGLGAVFVVLGLVSLSVLPVEAAGLLFLLLAAVLFVAELFAPGIGVAAALGSVSLVLAALFAFSDDAPGLSVSLAAVIPTAAVVGVAVIVAGRLALRARAGPASTGPSGLVGREVEVARLTDGGAQARIGGGWWTLRGEGLAVGDRVQVTSVRGVELHVEAVDGHVDRADDKEEQT